MYDIIKINTRSKDILFKNKIINRVFKKFIDCFSRKQLSLSIFKHVVSRDSSTMILYVSHS